MKKLLILCIALVTACQAANAIPIDPANATYTIDQRKVTLTGGVFEGPAAPGSAAKATTRLLDKRASGDLNGDGKPDVVVILTSSGGGSGTFSYVVALLGAEAGTSGSTNAVLLGDRITVNSVRSDGGKISVDLLDRNAGEPFSTAPTLKLTRVFQVTGSVLAEIK